MARYNAALYNYHSVFDLTCKTEAVFFPVLAVVYPGSNDLLHKVLGVGTFDRLRIFRSSVGHDLILDLVGFKKIRLVRKLHLSYKTLPLGCRVYK